MIYEIGLSAIALIIVGILAVPITHHTGAVKSSRAAIVRHQRERDQLIKGAK